MGDFVALAAVVSILESDSFALVVPNLESDSFALVVVPNLESDSFALVARKRNFVLAVEECQMEVEVADSIGFED